MGNAITTIQVRIKVKKGKLTTLGYYLDRSDEQRHKALRAAVRKYGRLDVERMLIPEITYRKNHHGDKVAHEREIFRKDLDYVRTL